MPEGPALDFERLFEAVPSKCIVLDPGFVVVAASNAYLEEMQASRQEVLGRSIFEVVVGLDATSIAGLANALDLVARELTTQSSTISKDRPRFEAEGDVSNHTAWRSLNVPVLDQQGRLAHIIHHLEVAAHESSNLTGVIDAQQMEAELLQGSNELLASQVRLDEALEAAEQSKRFLESILENIPNMVFVKDAKDLRLVRLNRAMEELVGSDRNDIIGRANFDLFAEDDAEFFTKFDREVLDNRRPVDVPDAVMQTRFKGPRLLHTRKVPILDEFGEPQFLLGISEDITESRAAESKIAEINRHLVQSLADLSQRNEEMVQLNELGDLLQACVNSEEAWRVISHGVPLLFPNCAGAVSILKPSRNLLDVMTTWGGRLAAPTTFAPDQCWALRRGRTHESGMSAPPCDHLDDLGSAWALCIPMVAQGETIGAFHLLPDDSEISSSNNAERRRGLVQLASMASEQIGMATANLDLRDKLRHLSIRDPLTNLFNRRYMEETFDRELERAQRNNEEVAVVQIDIDHFKMFNDTHGHEAGDIVLKAVADVLFGCTRGGDVACRYGGEELTLILPNTSLGTCLERTEEIRTRLRETVIPFRGSVLTPPTISMGIAAFPDHGDSAEVLLRISDAALYRAKHEGRDRVVTATSI